MVSSGFLGVSLWNDCPSPEIGGEGMTFSLFSRSAGGDLVRPCAGGEAKGVAVLTLECTCAVATLDGSLDIDTEGTTEPLATLFLRNQFITFCAALLEAVCCGRTSATGGA